MKKILCAVVLFAFPCAMMIGCGGASSETTIIEGELEEGQESITSSQMSEYEAAMKSGGGSAESAPGN